MSLFIALPRERRIDHRRRYLDLLRRRNGSRPRDAALPTRRALRLQELIAHPVHRRAHLTHDVAELDRLLRGGLGCEVRSAEAADHEARGAAALQREALWRLCIAGVLRSERFAMDCVHERDAQRPQVDHRAASAPASLIDEISAYIQVEEDLHCLILAELLRTAGGEPPEGEVPRGMTRLLLRLMVHLPAAVSNVLTLGGEIIGVALFQLLLEEARELFSGDPPVRARLEFLLNEILTDEIGHVHYVRGLLGPSRLRLMERLLPLMIPLLLQDLPEAALLMGPRRLRAQILQVPKTLPDPLTLSRDPATLPLAGMENSHPGAPTQPTPRYNHQ